MLPINFIDSNGISVSAFSIEGELDFNREQYEEKRELCKSELLDFDDFLENVIETIRDNYGNYYDAIFIANDAFEKL